MIEQKAQMLEEKARLISEILKEDYNWNEMAFVDGMAPIDIKGGRQVWTAKTELKKRIIGGSNGRTVPVGAVIDEGDYLKFLSPEDETQKSMDFLNWRGYFDNEAVYSDDDAGFVLNRWVQFRGFSSDVFGFFVEYLEANAQVCIPSIVFFGVPWIKYVDQRSV